MGTISLRLSFFALCVSLHPAPIVFVPDEIESCQSCSYSSWSPEDRLGGESDENIGLAEGQLAGAGRTGTELIECFVLWVPGPTPGPSVSVNMFTAHPISRAKCLKAEFASLFPSFLRCSHQSVGDACL